MRDMRRSVAAAAVVGTVVAGMLAGCGQEAPPPDADITVADLADAETNAGDGTSDWIGREVTVRGHVLEIVEPGAFRIGDPGTWEPSVLVLSPTADFADAGLDVTDAMIEDETTVEVTGTVRRLSLGQFQEDYDIPYDESVFEDYAGDAVVVVDHLTAVTED